MRMQQVNIGLSIEKKLNELGISKSEFGRKIGVPQQNVNRILSKTSINTEKLVAISEALDYNFFSEFVTDFAVHQPNDIRENNDKITSDVIMTENQRFKETFIYLRKHKQVRNQQDFTERIGSDKSTISQIMNERISIPNNLFIRISTAFPFIDTEWIRTGNGTMLKSTYVQQEVYGGEIITQTGNITDADSGGILTHAMNEITEMRKLLSSSLEAYQRTNDRLLTLLENIHNKD